MGLASNYYATCASRLTTRALDCPGEAMRRQQFAPAARRPGGRIRVGGIAVVLGVLVTLAAEDRTQAQNAPRVSRILPGASVLNPSKLAGSEENLRGLGYVEGRNIGENSAGKISSAGGSGGRRCEMSPEEFAKFYPPLLDWISNHVDHQRTCGANRRLSRVFAAAALFHRKDSGSDKGCLSRSVANATPIFDGVSALCRF